MTRKDFNTLGLIQRVTWYWCVMAVQRTLTYEGHAARQCKCEAARAGYIPGNNPWLDLLHEVLAVLKIATTLCCSTQIQVLRGIENRLGTLTSLVHLDQIAAELSYPVLQPDDILTLYITWLLHKLWAPPVHQCFFITVIIEDDSHNHILAALIYLFTYQNPQYSEDMKNQPQIYTKIY